MKTKTYLYLVIIFFYLYNCIIYAQVSEVYIMASPSLRNATTANNASNQKSDNNSSRKITVIPILATIQFNLKPKYLIRINYYYQNYSSINSSYYNSDKTQNNYSKYNDETKKQTIQSAYFDILKKQNYSQIQLYYGLWLGTYYQAPYSRVSSRTNFINNSQDQKQISQTKYTANYGAKIGIVISTYFKVYTDFYIGLEMRNAIDYNISKGTEEQIQSIYDSQNRYVDSQTTKNTTNSKQTSLQLFNPFFSLKYTIPQLKYQQKSNNSN